MSRWYIYHYGVDNHPDVADDERYWWERLTLENYDMIADETLFANRVIENDGCVWSTAQTQELFSDKVRPTPVHTHCPRAPRPCARAPVSMHMSKKSRTCSRRSASSTP